MIGPTSECNIYYSRHAYQEISLRNDFDKRFPGMIGLQSQLNLWQSMVDTVGEDAANQIRDRFNELEKTQIKTSDR